MPEITESCKCGAVFRYKGFFLVEGLGEAVEDFRNRHATCRGKVVVPRPAPTPRPDPARPNPSRDEHWKKKETKDAS